MFRNGLSILCITPCIIWASLASGCVGKSSVRYESLPFHIAVMPVECKPYGNGPEKAPGIDDDEQWDTVGRT